MPSQEAGQIQFNVGKSDATASMKAKLLFLALTTINAAIPLVFDPSWNGLGISLVVILGSSVVGQYLWPADDRGGPDASDPMFLAGVVVFLAFGARSLAYIQGDVGTGRADLPFWSGLGNEFNATYAAGLAFAVLCWFSMVAGYRFTGGLNRQPHTIRTGTQWAPQPPQVIRMFWLLLGLGWSARIYLAVYVPNRSNQLEAVDLGSAQSFANALTILAPIGFILVLFASFRNGRVVKSMAWLPVILLLADIGYGWYMNNRTLIFSSVIIVLGYLALARPVRIHPRVICVIPIVLIGLSISLIYRDAPKSIIGVLARTTYVIEQAQEEGSLNLVGDGWQSLVNRYHGLDSVTAILNSPPMPVPRYGAIYIIDAALPLVPRAVWPSKPVYPLGNILSIHYFNFPTEYSVPMVPTWFGDLTVQFPYPVVPFFCAGLGALIRKVRVRSLRDGQRLSFWSLLGVSVLPFMVQSDAWLPLYQITIQTATIAGIFLVWRSSSAAVPDSVMSDPS